MSEAGNKIHKVNTPISVLKEANNTIGNFTFRQENTQMKKVAKKARTFLSFG